MTTNTDEPVYYGSTSFSGVGFALPGDKLPEGAFLLNGQQVDPDVRQQGRDWLAEKVG